MATKPLAPVRSAGAVAHRKGKQGLRILLVHRPKYGDWSLPKGHLDDGEPYEDAALRELEEEAGVTGELGPLVGSIGYRVRRRPKVVRYWLVEAEKRRFVANSEVDEIVWVSPKKALVLSSYDDDRAVIAAAARLLKRPRSARVQLIRHTDAGSRTTWKGDDLRRPLSVEGRREARQITSRLVRDPVTDVLSSTYRRCEQTVAPLAHALDLAVEIEKALIEGQPPEQALDLLAGLEGRRAVLSSHGDIISGLIGMLAAEGVELVGELEWKKASVWDLDLDKGRVRQGRYVPPPR